MKTNNNYGPILWPIDGKSGPIGKDPEAGKDWGQKEKGMTEDEIVGWHHRLNGHGFEWTPAIGDGQGGLAWCSSWGHKESDTTKRPNWTELNQDSVAEEWTHKSIDRIEMPEYQANTTNRYLTKIQKQINGRNIVFSTNSTGTIGLWEAK